MQRWGINERNLPPGSNVLFREPGIWEKYSWQLSLIACVILIQGGLIGGLLHERRRRRLAEVESRQRLAELAHLNRYSAVGELTTGWDTPRRRRCECGAAGEGGPSSGA